MTKLKTFVREAFPSVSQLDGSQLEEWMKRPSPTLLLVDVRAPEEFSNSHLKGARNQRTAGQIAQAVRDHKPGKTILYCSVGFRSSRLAHLLSSRGMPGISNLEGSIFQWANEGRPLFQGNVPVKKVHPYGKRWAGLLKDGLAADV
jgi:rhodanese-related sulfurtransferase